MPILAWRLNFSLIELHVHAKPAQVVGVRLRARSYRYMRWLGFIERRCALRIDKATPVKLQVERYYRDQTRTWIELAPGQHVQGCLVAEGVYAVTNRGNVRIV